MLSSYRDSSLIQYFASTKSGHSSPPLEQLPEKSIRTMFTLPLEIRETGSRLLPTAQMVAFIDQHRSPFWGVPGAPGLDSPKILLLKGEARHSDLEHPMQGRPERRLFQQGPPRRPTALNEQV